MTDQDQKQLGNTLWGIADQLRGAMNADDFRDYMLSFLFLRFLSDSYETASQKELRPDSMLPAYQNLGDVNYRQGKFYCTNVCGVLLNQDAHANLCIAAFIDSVSKMHVSYVGNPKLMNGVMSKIVVPFPSVKVQQKIADCLASLDNLITAQTQKLATLKTHKKGLMQQLFPVLGDE